MSIKSPTKNTRSIEQLISDSFECLEAQIERVEREAEKALNNSDDLVKLLNSHTRCLDGLQQIEKKRNKLAGLIASLSDDDAGGDKP